MQRGEIGLVMKSSLDRRQTLLVKLFLSAPSFETILTQFLMLFQMTTPCLRKFFALAVAGFLCQGLFGGKRPNFLFIIVDDQSPLDLKIYNPRSILDTPNLDRLARKAWCWTEPTTWEPGWGVCTPSRHMVMSGRTVWCVPDKPGRVMNHCVTNPKKVPPDLAQYTLPAVFNRAGYDTILQERQQLRSGQQAFHSPPRWHPAGWHRRDRQSLARGTGHELPQRARRNLQRQGSLPSITGSLIPTAYAMANPFCWPSTGPSTTSTRKTCPANPKQPPLPIGWLPGHPSTMDTPRCETKWV